MCPKSQFLYPKLTFVKVIEWGKWVKVPRPAKCTKNHVIFSNRYIHIPRTSKYPEKLLKLWTLCGKLPFLWWLGGSRIYMRFCLEKICPWRHSNCWLPNSFIPGGGRHSKFWNAGKMQFSSFAVLKKHINIFSSQWQLQAFRLAAHLGDKTKVFINDGDPLLKLHSHCLFNTISGWVRPLFPEAYLPQVCVQNRNFCTRNSLLSRLSNGESE